MIHNMNVCKQVMGADFMLLFFSSRDVSGRRWYGGFGRVRSFRGRDGVRRRERGRVAQCPAGGEVVPREAGPAKDRGEARRRRQARSVHSRMSFKSLASLISNAS